MGVDRQMTDVEIERAIKDKQWQCKDTAFAAVEEVMRGKKSAIDGKEGLRSELIQICVVQVARYEELAREWAIHYGSLENTGRGVTFKDNFVNGITMAVQMHLLNRISNLKY